MAGRGFHHRLRGFRGRFREDGEKSFPAGVWRRGGDCEVHGDGLLLQRSPRGPRPGEEEAMRRGVLRQLSDFVSIASGPDGVWVQLSMRVA